MAKNRVIGLNNGLPWYLSADLKRFRQITMGKPIMMGRKTYEAVGRPLPGRINVVISRNRTYRPEGCLVFDSIEAAYKGLQQHPIITVIGGATLYQSCIHLAETIYLTIIDRDFEGDAYFPDIDLKDWRVVEKKDFSADNHASFNYSFVTYQRNGH